MALRCTLLSACLTGEQRISSTTVNVLSKAGQALQSLSHGRDCPAAQEWNQDLRHAHSPSSNLGVSSTLTSQPHNCTSHGVSLRQTWPGVSGAASLLSTSMPWSSALPHIQTRGAKTKVIMEYVPLPESKVDRYDEEPTNYLQLLGAITSAPNVNRLKYLVQKYAGAFDASQAVAVLNRLPKIAKYKDEDLELGVITSSNVYAKASEAGEKVRPPMQPRRGALPRPAYREEAASLALQIMAMIVGQANVSFVPPATKHKPQSKQLDRMSLWKLRTPDALKLGQKQAKDGALGPHFSTRHASLTIWSLGTLAGMGVQLDRNLVNATVRMALSAMSRKINTKETALEALANDVDVVQTLKGLAMLQPFSSSRQADVQVFADYMSDHASRLTSQQVAMALRSLAALGCTDGGLLARLADRAVALSKELTPKGVASILHSLASAKDKSNRKHGWHALAVLSKAIAPQIVIMSSDDLSDLAKSISVLGVYYGSDPGRLPAWLSDLVTLLADKAVRDLSKLQPHQLAGVLGMVTAMKVPHSRLLQSVVDGLLVENELNPDLSITSGAAVLNFIATVSPLCQDTLQSTASDSHVMSPSISVLYGFAKHQKVRDLAYRETAAGLGNIEIMDATDTITTALGPLTSESDDATGVTTNETADLSDLAAGFVRPRQYYQRLLLTNTSMSEKCAAAYERVLALYAKPGVLSAASLSEMKSMADALILAGKAFPGVASITELSKVINSQVASSLEEYLNDMTTDMKRAAYKPDYRSNPGADMTSVSAILGHVLTLGQKNTTLAAAAHTYAGHLLRVHTSPGNSTAQIPDLLRSVVPLMKRSRQHGAEPVSAAKASAQVYVTMMSGGASGNGTPFPEHTASGLAPTVARAVSKDRATWSRVAGPDLATLLEFWVDSDATSQQTWDAVTTHVSHLLSDQQAAAGKSQSQIASEAQHADLTWMSNVAVSYLRSATTTGMVSDHKPSSDSHQIMLQSLITGITNLVNMQNVRSQLDSADRNRLMKLATLLESAVPASSGFKISNVLQSFSSTSTGADVATPVHAVKVPGHVLRDFRSAMQQLQ